MQLPRLCMAEILYIEIQKQTNKTLSNIVETDQEVVNMKSLQRQRQQRTKKYASPFYNERYLQQLNRCLEFHQRIKKKVPHLRKNNTLEI